MKKYVALSLALLFPCLQGVAHASILSFHPLQQVGHLLDRHGHNGRSDVSLPDTDLEPHANPAPAPSQHMAQGPRISLAEASRMVQQSTGGRILEARPQNVGGHVMYRIKVLTNNEVRIVMVDAETGAME